MGDTWNELPESLRSAWIADCVDRGSDAGYAPMAWGSPAFIMFVRGFRANCDHEWLELEPGFPCARCGSPHKKAA